MHHLFNSGDGGYAKIRYLHEPPCLEKTRHNAPGKTSSFVVVFISRFLFFVFFWKKWKYWLMNFLQNLFAPKCENNECFWIVFGRRYWKVSRRQNFGMLSKGACQEIQQGPGHSGGLCSPFSVRRRSGGCRFHVFPPVASLKSRRSNFGTNVTAWNKSTKQPWPSMLVF